jgi:hypothetical protein
MRSWRRSARAWLASPKHSAPACPAWLGPPLWPPVLFPAYPQPLLKPPHKRLQPASNSGVGESRLGRRSRAGGRRGGLAGSVRRDKLMLGWLETLTDSIQAEGQSCGVVRSIRSPPCGIGRSDRTVALAAPALHTPAATYGGVRSPRPGDQREELPRHGADRSHHRGREDDPRLSPRLLPKWLQ